MISHNRILLVVTATVVAGIAGVIWAPQSVVPFLGFCGLICTSLFQLLKQAETAEKVEEAAGKVEVVRQTLETTNRADTEKLDKIHTLVNSGSGVQKKIIAIALRRIARNSGDPEDIAAAELAETDLEQHNRQQAIVDGREKEKLDIVKA